MSVSKESILAKVTHKEILEYFLREYAYNLKEGKHISNPLLSRRQKTPSFNIYYSNRSSTWRWKDFAGGDGSAFDLVMQLYNVDFPHACDIINTRMNLGIAPGTPIPARLKQDPPPNIEDRNYDYTLYEVNWS